MEPNASNPSMGKETHDADDGSLNVSFLKKFYTFKVPQHVTLVRFNPWKVRKYKYKSIFVPYAKDLKVYVKFFFAIKVAAERHFLSIT